MPTVIGAKVASHRFAEMPWSLRRQSHLGFQATHQKWPTPREFDQNPAVGRQKDSEARWTKKKPGNPLRWEKPRQSRRAAALLKINAQEFHLANLVYNMPVMLAW